MSKKRKLYKSMWSISNFLLLLNKMGSVLIGKCYQQCFCWVSFEGDSESHLSTCALHLKCSYSDYAFFLSSLICRQRLHTVLPPVLFKGEKQFFKDSAFLQLSPAPSAQGALCSPQFSSPAVFIACLRFTLLKTSPVRFLCCLIFLSFYSHVLLVWFCGSGKSIRSDNTLLPY